MFHFKMLLISLTIVNSMLLSNNSYQDRHTVLITNDELLKNLFSCNVAMSLASLSSEAPLPKSRSLCAGLLSNKQIHAIIP